MKHARRGNGRLDDENFETCFAMRLRRAYLTMHRRAQARFERWDVTADQYVVMRLISVSPGLTQRDLVERSYSDPSTVGAMVRLLHRRGLVDRRESASDRRAWMIYLTARGQSILMEMIREDREIHRSLARAVGDGCSAEVAAALDAVAAIEEEVEGKRIKKG